MYLVIELQNNNGQLSHLVTAKETRAEAEQLFHQILTYAATSGLTSHAAVMLDDEGNYLRKECYKAEQN